MVCSCQPLSLDIICVSPAYVSAVMMECICLSHDDRHVVILVVTGVTDMRQCGWV